MSDFGLKINSGATIRSGREEPWVSPRGSGSRWQMA